MFRNPFDSWTNSLPKPKKFGMPNQSPSTQNQIFSQPDMHPWRNTFFDDTTGPPDPTQTPEAPNNEWGSYLSEMRDIYTKQGPAMGAYQEHLGNIPQYQKPGGWHKFGSALVGAATGLQQGAGAGWKAGQEALHLPYQRAMDEWGTKEQALGRQADIEDKSTGRRLAFMKEVREVAKDEQDYKRLMAKHNLDVDAQKSLNRYREAQIEELGTRGWSTYVDNRGHRISYNPKTEETKDWGPDIAKTNTEIAKGNQAISGYNAATSRGQLGVSQGQLALGQRNAERLERGETPPVTGIEQSTIRESSLTRAAAENDKWTNYFTSEGGLQPRPSDPKEAQQYDRFMNRVKAIEQEILSTRRPAPTYDYIRR